MPATARAFDAYFLSQTQSSLQLLSTHCRKEESVTQLDVVDVTELKLVRDPALFDEERKIHRACARCRRLKQKCDNERPCRACIRRGCAGDCVHWDMSRALSKRINDGTSVREDAGMPQVPRPISWRQALVRVERPGGQGATALEEFSSNRDFLRVALRNFGVSRGPLEDVVTGIPDELCDALVDLVKIVSQRTGFLRKLFASGLQARKHFPRSQLQQYSEMGYLKCTFETTGAGLSWDFQINDGYCRLLHTHPEELLARTQYDDLELPVSRIDLLCHIVDCLDISRIPTSGREGVVDMDRFCALTRGPAGTADPLLCRAACKITFDAAGDMRTIERFLLPISADEYDLHRQLTPHLCRPFSAALGDTRSGAELLTAYRHERSLSLAEWRATEEGATALRLLAVQVRHSNHHLRSLLNPTSQPAPAPRVLPLAVRAEQREEAEVRGAERLAGGGEEQVCEDSAGAAQSEAEEPVRWSGTVAAAAGTPPAVSGDWSPTEESDLAEEGGWGSGRWGLIADVWSASDAGLLSALSFSPWDLNAWSDSEPEAIAEDDVRGVWLEELA